jgi:hypothetical protein
VILRQGLETLEREATPIRVLCRSLADLTQLAGEDNRLIDPEIRERKYGATDLEGQHWWFAQATH